MKHPNDWYWTCRKPGLILILGARLVAGLFFVWGEAAARWPLWPDRFFLLDLAAVEIGQSQGKVIGEPNWRKAGARICSYETDGLLFRQVEQSAGVGY